jgi:hypothetical protein
MSAAGGPRARDVSHSAASSTDNSAVYPGMIIIPFAIGYFVALKTGGWTYVCWVLLVWAILMLQSLLTAPNPNYLFAEVGGWTSSG